MKGEIIGLVFTTLGLVKSLGAKNNIVLQFENNSCEMKIEKFARTQNPKKMQNSAFQKTF